VSRTALVPAAPAPARRPRDLEPLRRLADQAFSRAGGAPLVGGNHVAILRDATENYPAWERAIRAARRTIHVEMYIIHRDAVGRWFVDLLAQKAREGVKVRLAYDWFGCGVGPMLGLLRPLVTAGGEVLPFNPPRLGTALGWVRRNHRKLIVIDSEVAFISGLCLGRMWAGEPKKHREPWRDTGTEIRGPAVTHAEAVFAETWRLSGGGTLDEGSLPAEEDIAPAGHVSLRLIATEPFTAALLRVDLLVAAMARRTLWIADAYFLAHGPFVSALQQTAEDGVDVRLLVPQGSDVGWTVPMSRTLYRTLLDSGIRIFEWNGRMMHAKTAVADGRWARIGSTNLNLNSWIGNWELDVAIEDDGIARTMERHYEEDLARATEIVPSGRHRPRALGRGGSRPLRRPSARRALRTVTRLGHSIGAAVTGNRQLQSWESAPLLTLGLLLLGITALAWWKPMVLLWPIIVMCVWIGLSFVAEGLGLWRKGKDDP
jgi:phosphatidylserine/phosphatidylglycerophosphate/cardiolipin synthase-like enzyme